MIDLRQVISREEMDILFHDNDVWRSIVTDEGDMIMVQIWLGINEVSEKYIEYQDNEDYGYFYGTFREMLTVLADTDIIRFYKKVEDPDYPRLDEEDIKYLKSIYKDELDRAIVEIRKQCGPFQLYYSKEKVCLFQKIYFNPGGGLCRKGTLDFLLRTIKKTSSSDINAHDFIDWMGLEEKYAFYNWEFLIFAIGYSTPENIAKMFAYITRFMTEEERENFHFELLAEKNVVLDNTMTQFKGKFQNYYYKIEEMGNDVEGDAIDSFIEEINHLKFLASEGVLESSKQSDLITRMRGFKYEEITDNVIFLLKVKKIIQSSTQTIYTDRHGGFSSTIHQFIQDWDNLFREFKGKKETDTKIVEDIKKEDPQILQNDRGQNEIENTNKITVSLGIDSENIVQITQYISYDKKTKEFINPKNGAKFKLKEGYSRQMIELLIFKNEQNVIDFVEDNKVILSEYKKGKRGGGKWEGMHSFLQSKIKNIGEKIESKLGIEKELRTSFLSCTKEFIAIKVLHK